MGHLIRTILELLFILCLFCGAVYAIIKFAEVSPHVVDGIVKTLLEGQGL